MPPKNYERSPMVKSQLSDDTQKGKIQRKGLPIKPLKHPFPPATYLSQWDNEATQVLLLAGEADIVRGHKHLPQNVHFVEWSPEGAVCVAI